jgi:hypothetical protein
MIPYILTDESLTVVVNGKSLTMESSNPSFREAVKAISDERWDDIEKLFDTSQAVEDYADGKVKVVEGVVYYDGDEHEMTRNKVCDDANVGCSHGFHAGSLDYAKSYGNGGHLMVVEIDPRDVVSVPLDCDQQKLRTAKYKVVAHFEKKLEEPMCDDYDDYGDWQDDDSDDSDDYNEGYDAGYEAGKAAAASN